MSAPVVERPRGGATRTAPPAPRRAAPTQRRGATPVPGRGTSASPERVRRTDRTQAPGDRRRTAARSSVRAEAVARAPFVLTVMVLLGVGLVATLWLSTAAAADSYRLQDARTAARDLSERSERLHREVAALQS